VKGREGRIVTGHSENDPRDVCRISPMVLLLQRASDRPLSCMSNYSAHSGSSATIGIELVSAHVEMSILGYLSKDSIRSN